MATLPNDVARCPGVAEVNAKLPIRICETCARWQSMGTGGPATMHIQAPARLRHDGDGMVIFCDRRIEG